MTTKTQQFSSALDSMLASPNREIMLAYRDAIISDIGHMERQHMEAIAALKAIAAMAGNRTEAQIEQVNGVNDGRDRAILAAFAVETARALIAKVGA